MIELTGSYDRFKEVVSRRPTLVYVVGGAVAVNAIVSIDQDFRWVPNSGLLETDFLIDFPQAVKVDHIAAY